MLYVFKSFIDVYYNRTKPKIKLHRHVVRAPFQLV